MHLLCTVSNLAKLCTNSPIYAKEPCKCKRALHKENSWRAFATHCTKSRKRVHNEHDIDIRKRALHLKKEPSISAKEPVYLCRYIESLPRVSMYIYRAPHICTAYCIWSVISPSSKLNRLSSSLRLCCHVPFERVHLDGVWRIRWKDTSNAIGCKYGGPLSAEPCVST